MKSIIHIKGMHCNSCKLLIEDLASEIAGIISCVIDMKKNIATVEYDSKEALQKFKKEIESSGGYEVKL